MSTAATLNHVTLLCAASQLERIRRFYGSVLDLHVGERPGFPFDGLWLYSEDAPILHIAATLPEPSSAPSRSGVPGSHAGTEAPGVPALSGATGPVDHLAFRVAQTVEVMKSRLRDLGLPFAEAAVPGIPQYQLFVVDPLGVKVEINLQLR